jgi:hypothetical protein
MSEESNENIIVGLGDNTWYSPSIMRLLAQGLLLENYLRRHVKGDSGECAVTTDEVLAHSTFISEDGFPIISAFRAPEVNAIICFVTKEDRSMTYIFSVQLDS